MLATSSTRKFRVFHHIRCCYAQLATADRHCSVDVQITP
jgi:hypothetical protein